jgi:N-acetylglutamate synthase-like GNAT family acetyltransferase
MTLESHRVRRATVEDLPGMKVLWESMQFAADELEKRLTEFQVVEAADGGIVGTIGVQMAGPHARLHSEAYTDFAAADDARALLMERIQSLASNHGVMRLWTQEKAQFWPRHGFHPANPDVLRKLPAAWTEAGTAWLTLQLKDEATLVSLEKELAMFMQTEKAQTARTLGHARTIKLVATLIALLLGIVVLGAVIYLLQKNPGLVSPKR